MIHGLNIQNKVLFTEDNQWTKGVTYEFLNRLYNFADLYVSPHGGEGFGLPFCEAMACETPFVATDCTTMPEFAGNNERGLLAKVSMEQKEKGVMRPWVDMKQFISKILYLLDDDDLRKKMGKAGKKWVEENCSKKVIIPQWKEVFEKLNIPICNVTTGMTKIEWNDKYNVETKK